MQTRQALTRTNNITPASKLIKSTGKIVSPFSVSMSRTLLIVILVATLSAANPPADFGFLVNIYSSRGAFVANCYGAKVTNDLILAPAHCLAGFELENIRVCEVDKNQCRNVVEPCLTPSEVYIHRKYLRYLYVGQLCPDIALLRFPEGTFPPNDILPINFDPDCNCEKYDMEIAQAVTCTDCKLSYIDVTIEYNAAVCPFGANFSGCYLYSVIGPCDVPDFYIESGSPLIYNGMLQSIQTFGLPDSNPPGPAAYPCLLPYQQEIENYSTNFFTLAKVNGLFEQSRRSDIILNQAFLDSLGIYDAIFKRDPLRGAEC